MGNTIKQNRRFKQFVTVMLSASVLLPTSLVQAQDSGAIALEEIIVTAERRESDLQDTPISITAFSQDALDEKGITDIQSAVNSTIGLQFGTATNAVPGVRINIRGVGTETLQIGSDQGVALHTDGVYMGRASSGLLSFYDVERMEVLRGPQGTLYGRNATGGSINIISAKPSQDFVGKFDLLGGNYSHVRARGVIGGGLSETVSGRLTATYEERDGVIENLVDGVEDLGAKDEWMLRGQLLFAPSENVEIIARVQASESRGTGPALKNLEYPATTLVGVIQPPVPPFVGTPFGVPNLQPIYGDALPLPDSLHQVRNDRESRLHQDAVGANLEINLDFDSFSVKSITGWFDNEIDLASDGDGSEIAGLLQQRVEKNDQITQELVFSSTTDGPLEWQFGGFYFAEDASEQAGNTPLGAIGNIVFPPNADLGATGFGFDLAATVESTSWAGFGQVSYFIQDDLRLTGGIRYSYDDKEGETTSRELYDLTTGIMLSGFDTGEYEDDWNETTYKIGLDYFVNDSSMLYGSFSTGYKSGGLNPSEPGNASFEPESIDAWEIGAKNRFFNDRVQANISAFFYDYTNLQLFTVSQTAPVVENAGESEIKGIELETAFAASENLTLNLSLAYLDAEITEFVTRDPDDPPALQVDEDLSGNRLPQSPEYEVAAAAAYTWPMEIGELSLSANYHWQSETFFRAFNDPDKKQGAYGELDARIELQTEDGWSVALFGKNLTDEESFNTLFVEAGLLGSADKATINDPRTFGLIFAIEY